ncbi:hypothetical protein Salat_2061500 [Sesamum alatum]|uniref:Uncharacterized protein n=1 Tax=Sesamum alatum TaxID=300844 RepID=A0AAE1XZV5_9LAMI|nr:hypothetical protein Salat_2061500 [Sesamum alatum]
MGDQSSPEVHLVASGLDIDVHFAGLPGIAAAAVDADNPDIAGNAAKAAAALEMLVVDMLIDALEKQGPEVDEIVSHVLVDNSDETPDLAVIADALASAGFADNVAAAIVAVTAETMVSVAEAAVAAHIVADAPLAHAVDYAVVAAVDKIADSYKGVVVGGKDVAYAAADTAAAIIAADGNDTVTSDS